ncbi:hypothetical protein [Nostoc sp.]
MKPTKGVSETIEDGYTQHKITGTVETPWFGGNVGLYKGDLEGSKRI